MEVLTVYELVWRVGCSLGAVASIIRDVRVVDGDAAKSMIASEKPQAKTEVDISRRA